MRKNIADLRKYALVACADRFKIYNENSLINTEKILNAFRENRISEFHFNPSTGYGYNDSGREKLDEVWATVFKAPAAIVRPHFVSGTHTLSTVLFALLEAGDVLLSAVGTPYDTLQSVIGISGDAPNSLQKKGIIYEEVPTKKNEYDLKNIVAAVNEKTKVVLIQRSRGYATRKTLFIKDIATIIKAVKQKNAKTICFVDNCYGEFVETMEPYEVGADIVAGSLIKNPGGGLAPTGGYIVGNKNLVELAADQLTAPGLGLEMGSYDKGYRAFFQGLFFAPHVVAQALQGIDFAAAIFAKLGYNVNPQVGDLRSDLIQTIDLLTEKNMCLFCEGLQSYSPVNGYVRPIPGALPGYIDPVIMACGAFIQGSSIELSADGPLIPPYTSYLQGGLIFEHNVLGILGAAERILENKNI